MPIPITPVASTGTAPEVTATCGTGRDVSGCRAPAASRYYLVEPWVHPQPDPTACGRCSVTVRDALWRVNWQLAIAGMQPFLFQLYGRASPLDLKASYDISGSRLTGDTTTSAEIALEPLPRFTRFQASITMLHSGADGAPFETEDFIPLVIDDGT